MNQHQLTVSQLQHLAAAFHKGAEAASAAMAKWLNVPSMVFLESLDQVPLEEAGGLLGDEDSTVCVCAMQLEGSLTGQLAFAFEDQCGLALTDLLLNYPAGTASQWGELEQSAALESTNIIGCAYLNACAESLAILTPEISELIPSPPEFRRDFAESVLQSLLLSQALEANTVFVAHSRFEIRKQSTSWTLLLVPDAASLARLCEVLPDD